MAFPVGSDIVLLSPICNYANRLIILQNDTRLCEIHLVSDLYLSFFLHKYVKVFRFFFSSSYKFSCFGCVISFFAKSDSFIRMSFTLINKSYDAGFYFL